MELTPSEQDRLLIFTASELAKSRLAAGLKLNKPEAIAIISNAVIEAARAGASHAGALSAGKNALTNSDLLPGIAQLLTGISIEAVFDDGRRLVVVNFDNTNSSDKSDLDLTYPGEVTRLENFPTPTAIGAVAIKVRNESKIQISVTSHMHFLEVNPKLRFDRSLAYGMRLNIASGTHVDFPPGEIVNVEVIPISGNRILIGFAGLVDGPLDDKGMFEKAMQKIVEFGYLTGEPS